MLLGTICLTVLGKKSCWGLPFFGVKRPGDRFFAYRVVGTLLETSLASIYSGSMSLLRVDGPNLIHSGILAGEAFIGHFWRC